MAKVLIVDDHPHVLDALRLLFEIRGGFEVCQATTPTDALAQLEGEDVGVVVHDMNFSQGTTSGQEGVELFQAVRQRRPGMPVVLLTAWASLETAVALVKQGANDYLQKPWDDERLLSTVGSLLAANKAELASETGAALCGLVYHSQAMHEVVSLALKVARSEVSVLITGPNGSGKEKLAQIVQANSLRQHKPFFAVNVGALPDALFSAELFGAEPGAFTGAKQRRVGRFEAADGGTLFLDEMGNLSMEGQAKLLRALQSGEFERLGSNQTRAANVRIIAATNVDLKAAIAEGLFREDLYYRLAVFELDVPPLCHRVEDIIPLAESFAKAYADGAPSAGLSAAATAALLRHDWPGNVRELQNRVRRALLLAEGGIVEPGHLNLGEGVAPPGTAGAATLGTAAEASAPVLRSEEPQLEPGANVALSLDHAERGTIERALQRADYRVSGAAELLGLSRQALYRRMGRLGIKLKRRL